MPEEPNVPSASDDSHNTDMNRAEVHALHASAMKSFYLATNARRPAPE
jgi:hypothetical protein